jgi:hypothetical protein
VLCALVLYGVGGQARYNVEDCEAPEVVGIASMP